MKSEEWEAIGKVEAIIRKSERLRIATYIRQLSIDMGDRALDWLAEDILAGEHWRDQ